MIAILLTLFSILFEYIKSTSAARQATFMPVSAKKATPDESPSKIIFELPFKALASGSRVP
jgi:hypothetical protein